MPIRWRLSTILSSLPHERSNACLNFTVWGYTEFYWFKEFDPHYLDLGHVQGESRRIEGRQGHVYLREFDDGWPPGEDNPWLFPG